MVTRRQFTTLSSTAIGVAMASTVMDAIASGGDHSTAQPAATSDEALRSEFLFDVSLDTLPGNAVGFPGGDRLIVGVSGGTFQGPKLKGTVVRSGGDWIVRRPDGSSILDVRIVLLTDDMQRIYVMWRGIAYSGDSGELIARIVPMFETASAKYLWLNNVVSVGAYRPLAGKVAYRVYRIL